MSLTLRTTLGCTEAVIDDDGGLKCFYQVADILSGDLRIRFTNKEDDFDTIDWEFSFHGHTLTLHYSIYTGVSIFPSRTRDAMKKDNRAVVELASLLERKLIDFNLNWNIACGGLFMLCQRDPFGTSCTASM
jgi:hypothetical protein